MSDIYFRNEKTGNAWWPLDPGCVDITFEDNTQYRINGRVFTVDTMYFRDKHYEAIKAIVWDTLNKKDP